MKQAHGNLLELVVPGLSENRPSVLKGDRLYAKFSESSDNVYKYEGFVHQVLEKSILLGFGDAMLKKFLHNVKLDIRFTVAKYPLDCMHHALELTSDAALGALFPERSPKDMAVNVKSFFNRNIAENEEQKRAVENIVGGGLPGVPYIIFGPPGTGKTVTIVEAIHQVYKVKPTSVILATAPSNAGADVLASRIKANVPASQILRYYAPSRDEAGVPDALKDISNFRHSTATIEDVKKFRVIVVTLVTAARLTSSFKGHFSHIFIDEAGQATEPEACIPITGLLGPSCQLVLAGDHKQLGPVIRASFAHNHGLQISLLERLMSTSPLYQRPYHPCCVTKLLANYRSHEDLLTLPSRLFYEGELVAAAGPLVNTLVNWNGLPCPGTPLVFHGIVGRDKQEANSPSFFNAEEVVTVVDYIKQLLALKPKIMAKEIGVISPYRKQIEKIKDVMNRAWQKDKAAFSGADWRDITISSTEQFQGQERRIIIITTVRSEPDNLKPDFEFRLGFLKNPKRFNVATTRAKALMIVVGNPKLLSLDPYWKEFIMYAKDKGAYKGVQFDYEDPKMDLELKELEMRFGSFGLDGTETSSSAYSTSSFDHLSVSGRTTTPDNFEMLDEVPDMHEDAPEAHFDQ